MNENNKIATFQERLLSIMLNNNLKQVDIVEKCKYLEKRYNLKISKSYINNYLKKGITPNKERIKMIAEALNVSPQWLEGYDVPRQNNDLESTLLHKFRKLSDNNQNKVVDFAEALLLTQPNEDLL